MTESTTGTTPEQERERIAEMLRANALAAGADLTDCPASAGFLGAMAAILAYAATGLSDADRRTHAETVLAMIDTIAVGDPAFDKGWNAALQVQQSVVDRALSAGTMSQQARNYLLDASATLLRAD